MRALLFDGKLRLADDAPAPVPPPGEALVRVRLAGICNTDLEITRGYLSYHGVIGHEFVGDVVQGGAGNVPNGARVVGEINAACGRCPTCLAGRPTHCPNRTTLGIGGRAGALAEYLALPLENLHPVPASVPDEDAVFSEPLAAAIEIPEHVHLRPTSRVAVLGDGKLGLLVAQVLRLSGCELRVIGRHPEKWDVLHGQGIAAGSADEEQTEHQDDVVVDCTGNPSGFELASRLVRPRGVIVLKSTFHGAAPIALTPLVVDEVVVHGSRCGPFAPALRLLERRLVQVEPLISAVYPLADGLAAFARAVTPGSMKVLVKP